MAEDPVCPHAPSIDANDLGTKDCSSARRSLLSLSTNGLFELRLEIARSMRDLAIFNLAIDSKLRACDLVKLRLDDICSGTNVRRRATIVQKKTGRPVQFEISEQSRSSVEAWLPMLRTTGSRYLFPTRIHASPHISTRQYARLVHRWVKSIGLELLASYGTHLMCRTKCAQIYRRTGNLRAVQLLLGHTKLESTVRYLGIEVDDALNLAEQIELSSSTAGLHTGGRFRPQAVAPYRSS